MVLAEIAIDFLREVGKLVRRLTPLKFRRPGGMLVFLLSGLGLVFLTQTVMLLILVDGIV